MKNTILIITEELDAHTDFIIPRLQAKGFTVFRFHAKELSQIYLSNFQVDFDSLAVSFFNSANNRTLNFNDVISVWYRRTPDINFNLPLEQIDFAQAEYRAFLNGIWEVLDCYWISHPRDLKNANWKPEQLYRARKWGFSIPSTLISTDPVEIRKFYHANNQEIIYKTLSHPGLGVSGKEKSNDLNDMGFLEVKTTLLTSELMEELDGVTHTPCLFQALIPKKYELRITVIGNKVFSAEIHSQVNSKTQIDWRDYSVEIPYKKASLTSEFEAKCLEFVKSYNLNYGALDFIVTPENDFIFLELNPVGQFYFIEQKVNELKMLDHLVDCLIEARNL